MKKLTQLIRIIVLSFLLLFTVNSFSFFSGNVNTNALGNNSISKRELYLENENNKLKKDLKLFEDKLNKINNVVIETCDYNNYIYSEILGISTNKYNGQLKIYDSQNYDTILINLNNKINFTYELAILQLNESKEKYPLLRINKNIMDYYPVISPIKIKDMSGLPSRFGWRKHPIFHKEKFHYGIDIDAEKGTNVYATANGKITKIRYSKFKYGNHIVIKHAFGYETLYSHLNSIELLNEGQYVKKGQLIGTVGKTGLATGYHLHYEITYNGKRKDPLGYFYEYINDELIALKKNK